MFSMTDPNSVDRALAQHVTADGGNLVFFKSAEITGDGTEQSTAHGLGKTPTFVFVTITENDGTAIDIAQGTHDATNVKITVTDAAIKYIVYAL